MERANVRELKAHASEILRRVREEGATYEITSRGKVVATISPPPQQKELLVLRDLWAPLVTEDQVEAIESAPREVRREVEADLERLYQEVGAEIGEEPPFAD